MDNKENPRVAKWLETNIPSYQTKCVYTAALRLWINHIYGIESDEWDTDQSVLSERIDRYVADTDRTYIDDRKSFIISLRNKQYANNTVRVYNAVINKFLSRQPESREDQRFFLDEMDKDDIKRILPANAAALDDEVISTERMVKILECLSLQIRVIILFLVSSGCRIGEALQITVKAVNLKADPPYVNIKAEWTKKGLSKRRVWFNYETRDAILSWHEARKGRRKKVRARYSYESQEDYDTRSLFDETLLFGCTNTDIVRAAWNSALVRSGFGKTDSTKRMERFVHHMHVIRANYRTRLCSSGVPTEIVEGWLGRKRFLGMYLKHSEEELAKLYKEHMGAVSVYGTDRYRRELEVWVTPEEGEKYRQMGWITMQILPDGRLCMRKPD